MSLRFVAFCDVDGSWYVSDTHQLIPLLPFSSKEIALIVRDDLNIQSNSISENTTNIGVNDAKN